MTEQPGWTPPSGPGGPGSGGPGSGAPGGPGGWDPYGGPGWAPPGGSAGYGQEPDWGGYGSPGGWGSPAAPRPGVIPLRPIGLGEILDGAVTSIRRNPAATLGLAAIIMTVYGVISAAITLYGWSVGLPNISTTPGITQQITPAQARQLAGHFVTVYVPVVLGLALLALSVDLLLTGMLTVVVGRSVLGQSVSPGQAWRAAHSPLGWSARHARDISDAHQAPDSYEEFLCQTAQSAMREPTAAGRSQGQAVH